MSRLALTGLLFTLAAHAVPLDQFQSAIEERPTEAPLLVATALAELSPEKNDTAEELVSMAVATLGSSRSAIHAIAPAAALAAPDFARPIGRGCLRTAPRYVTRQEVYGLIRESLVQLGRRPTFDAISPGGPLNPASLKGDANNP